MNKLQRRRAVAHAGTSTRRIALAAGVHHSTVARVVNGEIWNPDVAGVIAAHVGLAVATMWPKQAARSTARTAA
jgi:lambda repressor-like predicted transcriptional regulator